MVITSDDALPAAPKAGCLADVEAPEGSGRLAAETANVPVPAFAVTGPLTVTVFVMDVSVPTFHVPLCVTATGPLTPIVPLTGWGTAEPATFSPFVQAGWCVAHTT